MAGSSNILTYVLVGGAAYLAYNWFTNQSTVVAAPVPTPTPTPTGTTPPPVSYVPPVMSAQLQKLAGPGVTTLNADQWNYYYTSAPPTGLGQTGIANFDTIFFPNGRPADASNNPQMSASQFVAALGVTGLSGVGFGTRRIISVPKVYLKGRGFAGVKYTLGDLRKAGRR